MSQQVGVLDITFKAATDSRTKQYYIMKPVGSATPYAVQIATGVTDVTYGILQNKPNVGEAAVVRVLGTSKLVSGTPLTEGLQVTVDSSGRGYYTATDKDIVVGIVLEPSAATGDIIEVLVVHYKASI